MDDRLQKFAQLVEVGSFTRAARQLHISQPALTQAIHKLEQELGATLLVRSARKLELTDAGRAAYDAALDHQNVAEHLRAKITSIAKKRPSVTIGMTDSIAAVLCSTEAFDVLEQAADVTIVVNNSRYLREEVERRKLDIAFVIDDGNKHPQIISQAFALESLLLVTQTAAKDTTQNDLNRGKLRNFISYDKPSNTYRHIVGFLSEQGITTHIRLYSTSPDVMLDMVLRGKGTAILPGQLVGPSIASGELVTLLKPMQRPVAYAYLRGKVPPVYLTEFINSVSGTVS